MTSSTSDNNTALVVYRSIDKHEQQTAIDLWYQVFQCSPGFFERYFSEEASPYYQIGDTLGAWVDNKLVSAMHIRRLRLRSRDDTTEYLCGAIANVATLEDYRKHGYSRELLRMAIRQMEQSNEFDISILGTSKPNHYAILGWETISLPSPISIEWSHFNSSTDHQHHWHTVTDTFSTYGQLLLDIHSHKPRTYQLIRSTLNILQYWTGWIWMQNNVLIYVLPEHQQGYIVIAKVDKFDEIHISEWRALNVDIERKLLKLAANEIRRRHPQMKIIRCHTPPQYMSLEELEQWAGTVSVCKNDHTMIRNIRLSSDVLEKIKASFLSGHATFWQGDYF
jgi:predicted acetyltransferase